MTKWINHTHTCTHRKAGVLDPPPPPARGRLPLPGTRENNFISRYGLFHDDSSHVIITTPLIQMMLELLHNLCFTLVTWIDVTLSYDIASHVTRTRVIDTHVNMIHVNVTFCYYDSCFCDSCYYDSFYCYSCYPDSCYSES